MATLTLKKIDELERLVVERLRLELAICDLRDKELWTPEGRNCNERLREIARTRAEIYVELIPLLRQRVRNQRLRGRARKAAQARLDGEMEHLGAKWSARVDGDNSVPSAKDSSRGR